MNAALIALATVGVVALSGFGTRWGWWPYIVGLGMLGAGGGIGATAAAVTAIRVMLRPRTGVETAAAVGAIVISLGVFAMLGSWAYKGTTSPVIHDVSTDLDDPPAFQAVLANRAPGTHSGRYGGLRVADKQRAAYPDIAPVVLAGPPDRAFDRALAAVRAMGWEVVAEDRARGHIEATDETRWFGFRDDVVVRLTPADGGTRVDVRSASRVGQSDMGTNARRVRAYLARLQES